MSIFLLVLEGILSTDSEVEVKTIGWELTHKYVERFALFFVHNPTYITRYDTSLKLSMRHMKITSDEIKVFNYI